MFDKETLTALQEAQAIRDAGIALQNSQSTKEVAALPSDYRLHDLEPYLSNRRRARGTMTTSNLASFVDYVKANQEQGAAVFVDKDTMSAVAVLNLGTPDEPGHCDNKAVIKAEKTAVYKALLVYASGQGYAQKVVAEFLEDWAGYIECFAENGIEIRTSQAVAAVRKITIESMKKLESEEKSLGATKSAFESVQASSVEPLPTIIKFVCAPYDEFDQRMFVLRLGVLTGEATPKVNLRIIKIEEHQEEMAEELAVMVRDGFDNEIPVMLGAYARGN
jgi:uncharacterized protein YfdQ (DUF2303 family)